MEVFISVLAVAIAGSCLVALLAADASDARANAKVEQDKSESMKS